MRLVCRILACAATLVVGAVSMPSRAEAFEPRAPADFFGINAPELGVMNWFDQANANAHFSAINRAGVDWIRADVTWSAVEAVPPVAGAHVYNWVFYDAWAERLARNGLTWVAMPSGAPIWARPTDLACGGRSAPLVANAADYRAFVKAFVRRYGRGGSFWGEHSGVPYRPVTTVELWNEPNWSGFWCGGLNPETYARYAAAGADGAHEADPAIRVSAGGLVTTRENILRDGEIYGMATDTYLRRMVEEVPSLAQKLDALALHLYDADPDVNLSLIGWTRRQMDGLGLDGLELLITEFGWHTKAGTDWVSEATRAENFHRFVGQLARTDCNISGISPHNWLSQESDNFDPEHWFGLANADKTLKPAGRAYSEEIATYRGSGAAPAPRNVIELCGSDPPDQDDDGVPDADDDYPLDPGRSDGSDEVPPLDPDAPPSPNRFARVPADFYGVYVRKIPWEAATRKKYFDSMQAMRIGSARDTILWNHLEADAQGQYAWSETDPRVLGLAKRQIQIQPTFIKPPAWLAPTQQAGDAAFSSFLAAYARRYGRGGSFWEENGNLDAALAVDSYEIWSDVNLTQGGWDGSASAAEYATTYKAARSALKAVDPNAAAVVPLHATGTSGDAPDFLRAMVAARPELAGNIDSVYVQVLQPESANEVEDLVVEVRNALAETGNGEAPIRVAAGWYTRGAGAISEDSRSSLIAATADRLARTNCGVSGFFADAWVMDEADTSSPWDWLGIADLADGSLKPAGDAYAAKVRSFMGYGSTEPERSTIRSCGSGDVDRDGDGVPDPEDDLPVDPTKHDGTAPLLTVKGPKSSKQTATFRVMATDSSAVEALECKVDSGNWTPCGGKYVVRSLKPGKHVLRVSATDEWGNRGTSQHAWRVKKAKSKRR